MSTEHLPQLDAIASHASGKPCRVYLDDQFPAHVRGLAGYDPRSRHYTITLNAGLLSWMSSELDSVFYHEILHVKLGHVSTVLSVAQRSAAYRKIINNLRPQTHDDAYPTIGQQLREIEAEQEATRLRGSWPYAAYSLFALIQGKEVFA